MKNFKHLVLLLCATMVLASCSKNNEDPTPGPASVPVTGVTLDQPTLSLVVGGTETLIATVAPKDADNQTVAWSSDKTDIATVTDKGVVTAVKAGTATITVASVADNSKKDTCVVTVTATEVYFPDAKFRAILIGLGLQEENGDIDPTTAANKAVIEGITKLSLNNKEIESLEGIEYFINLKILNCADNKLTALDVTKNIALAELYCYGNQLTALDLSKNTALTNLECDSNQLTALDLTKNIALAELYCYANQLTALDLSKNTALTKLNCYGNQLTALDLSKNTALTKLYCYENQLTTLDITANSNLDVSFCLFGKQAQKLTLTLTKTQKEGFKSTDQDNANVVLVTPITWAEGNLVAEGANGAKVGTATDKGLYFQFGSLIGWSETGNPAIAVKPANFNGAEGWTETGKIWQGTEGTVPLTVAGSGSAMRKPGLVIRAVTTWEVLGVCLQKTNM